MAGSEGLLLGAAGVVAAAQLLPAATWLPAVRRVLVPELSGPGPADQVAVTFDDGPDPDSTPCFLAELDRLGISATFFCVGERAARAPWLVREIAARGHRVQSHGWVHRNQLLRPGGLLGQLRRARDVIGGLTGEPPTRYRPPYGVLSGEGVLACSRLGLSPVLWSRWGRDWEAAATPERVFHAIRPGLVGGATVLLHDTDAYAAPDCWRSGLGALPLIVDECHARGLRIGGLPG